MSEEVKFSLICQKVRYYSIWDTHSVNPSLRMAAAATRLLQLVDLSAALRQNALVTTPTPVPFAFRATAGTMA
jgi:hypothetical protein